MMNWLKSENFMLWWHSKNDEFKFVLIGSVGFYCISTKFGDLRPNLVYTYSKYDLSTHFIDNIFKRAWAPFLHTVKGWFGFFV